MSSFILLLSGSNSLPSSLTSTMETETLLVGRGRGGGGPAGPLVGVRTTLPLRKDKQVNMTEVDPCCPLLTS